MNPEQSASKGERWRFACYSLSFEAELEIRRLSETMHHVLLQPWELMTDIQGGADRCAQRTAPATLCGWCRRTPAVILDAIPLSVPDRTEPPQGHPAITCRQIHERKINTRHQT